MQHVQHPHLNRVEHTRRLRLNFRALPDGRVRNARQPVALVFFQILVVAEAGCPWRVGQEGCVRVHVAITTPTTRDLKLVRVVPAVDGEIDLPCNVNPERINATSIINEMG